jgi:hypothetical protein
VTLLLTGGLALVDGPPLFGPSLTALGALVVVDAGVLTILRGRSWPGLSARYERTPSGMWDALDRGEDPTL